MKNLNYTYRKCVDDAQHYICVNDLAQYQCYACRCLFDKQKVIICLKKRYSDQWQEKWKMLKKIKQKVRRGSLDIHSFTKLIWEYNGKIIERYYCEYLL